MYMATDNLQFIFGHGSSLRINAKLMDLLYPFTEINF